MRCYSIPHATPNGHSPGHNALSISPTNSSNPLLAKENSSLSNQDKATTASDTAEEEDNADKGRVEEQASTEDTEMGDETETKTSEARVEKATVSAQTAPATEPVVAQSSS